MTAYDEINSISKANNIMLYTKIPAELWTYILSWYLSPWDINRFSRACKWFHQIGTDKFLWKLICKNHGILHQWYTHLAETGRESHLLPTRLNVHLLKTEHVQEHEFDNRKNMECGQIFEHIYRNGSIDWKSVFSWFHLQREMWFNRKCEYSSLQAHDKGLALVQVSPDGQYIVTGGWDNTIRVWRLFKKTPCHAQLQTNCTSEVPGLLIDEDEIDDDENVPMRIQDRTDHPQERYKDSSFSDDGSRIVPEYHRLFRMEHPSKSAFPGIWLTNESNHEAQSMHSDSSYRAAQQSDKNTHSKLLQLVHDIPLQAPISANNFFWLDQEHFVIVPRWSSHITLWNVSSGRCVNKFVLNPSVTPISLLPKLESFTSEHLQINSQCLVSTMAYHKNCLAVTNGACVWVLQFATFSCMASGRDLFCHLAFQIGDEVDHLVWLNSSLLIVITQQGALHIVDIEKRTCARIVFSMIIDPKVHTIHQIQINKCSWEIHCGYKNGILKRWRIMLENNRKQESKYLQTASHQIGLSHEQDRVIHCQPLIDLNGSNEWVTNSTSLPSSNLIIASSWDGRIRIWDSSVAQPRRTFQSDNSAVLSICAMDGMLLAGSYDGKLTLWEF